MLCVLELKIDVFSCIIIRDDRWDDGSVFRYSILELLVWLRGSWSAKLIKFNKYCVLSQISDSLLTLLFLSLDLMVFVTCFGCGSCCCSFLPTWPFKLFFFNLINKTHEFIQETMSRKFDSVIDINDSKETWRLTVHILDLWTVINSKGIEHVEMVVMGAKVWYIADNFTFFRFFFIFLGVIIN